MLDSRIKWGPEKFKINQTWRIVCSSLNLDLKSRCCFFIFLVRNLEVLFNIFQVRVSNSNLKK